MTDLIKNMKETEPVRLYLYSVLVPVLALLVMKGVIGGDEMATYLAVGAAVLGVPAVEKARSKVDSPSTAAAKTDALEAEFQMNLDREFGTGPMDI